MGIYSPIATQIKFDGGTHAQISTPWAAVSGNYDPNSGSDWVPGQPVNTPVLGIYQDGIQSGLPENITAMFQIVAIELPPGLQASVSSLIMPNRTWQINSVRERWWRGKLDGYDFMLVA